MLIRFWKLSTLLIRALQSPFGSVSSSVFLLLIGPGVDCCWETDQQALVCLGSGSPHIRPALVWWAELWFLLTALAHTWLDGSGHHSAAFPGTRTWNHCLLWRSSSTCHLVKRGIDCSGFFRLKGGIERGGQSWSFYKGLFKGSQEKGKLCFGICKIICSFGISHSRTVQRFLVVVDSWVDGAYISPSMNMPSLYSPVGCLIPQIDLVPIFC